MSKNKILLIIVLIVILGGVGYLISRKKPTTTSQPTQSQTQATSQNKVCQSAPDMQLSNMNFPVTQPESKSGKLATQYTGKKAVVQTNCGTFTISFFDNDAPVTVENFQRLAAAGAFNGTPFHRIMSGFMIQTGDFTHGDGTGGQSAFGKAFADELNAATASFKNGYKRGVVAMANAGANTNGSQFFIMHADYPLPNQYTIFGQVTEGLDVVDKIASVKVSENAYGEPSVPQEKIIIEKVTLENK